MIGSKCDVSFHFSINHFTKKNKAIKAVITQKTFLRCGPFKHFTSGRLSWTWPCTGQGVCREWQHNDDIILSSNGIQEMATCTDHLPVLQWTTYIFTLGGRFKYMALIGTKCVAPWSEEGGTSTAIRGNWQYLQSTQECWHQLPPPWPQGTSVQRSNRSVEKLRSPCSAENDQRFCPSPGAADPSFLLGLHAHTARRVDWKATFEMSLRFVLLLIKKAISQVRWRPRVCLMNWILEILLTISQMIDDMFFPPLLQNNGSLVWCQNHKQCSKVMWFHFFFFFLFMSETHATYVPHYYRIIQHKVYESRQD